MDEPPVVVGPRKRRTRPSERLLRRRRAALVSTAYHAYRESNPRFARAPAFLRPMPLEAAVRVLIGDGYKPAMVQGLSWLMDNPEPPQDVAKYKDELKRVIDPGDKQSMTDLDRELSKLKPAVELRGAPHEQPIKGVRAFLKVGELQADEPAPEQSRFAMAYEILSPLSAGCKRENFACQISFDPETLVTQVDAQVDVNRAPLDFTVLADPSAWTEESPLFWQRSDLGDFTGGTFVSDSPQPAPGFGPYNNRGLFEAINLSWNPFFPLTGNNVLRATHGQLGHGILPLKGQCTASMHVSLDLSLDTTIGFSQARGGLDVDSGAVEIRSLDEPGTQTRLRASKRARFTERVVCGVRLGPWINMFAPFFLGPWIATLVYEGACTNSAKDGEDT